MIDTANDPTTEDLKEVFHLKYGADDALGWGPTMRRRFGYYQPDDWYEAIVKGLVGPDTTWADVGCGRSLFPDNAPLARQLSERCRRLVGIDPDATIEENPFVHERVRGLIDDYLPAQALDLVTLRMVAEHIEQPEAAVATLARLVAPGGHTVIYTVNKWSPVPLVTSIAPFALHQPVKRVLWRTEKKDTFPTCFRMNTRKRLNQLFSAGGFSEVAFHYLDDCRTLGRFRIGQFFELSVRSVLRRVGLRYPENCLLGVYRRLP